MAETDIFMSEEDLERIVRYLILSRCVLVPDVKTATPSMSEIDSIDDFQALRQAKATSLFFVLSDEWKAAPLEFGSFEKDGCETFFVRQKSGGPTLDIYAPFSFSSADRRVVMPHGFVAYHSLFWNPAKRTNEKPSGALKTMYKQIVKILLEGADQVAGKQRKYLVAKGVKARLEAGAILGSPFLEDNSNHSRSSAK